MFLYPLYFIDKNSTYFWCFWLTYLLFCCSSPIKAQGYIGYSTYIGGTGEEPYERYQVVNGETYIVAPTQSTNYPVTNGSINKLGFHDFVVTKLDNTGKIVYATFIGGTAAETDPHIVVENGEVYIVGITTSTNYPVTDGSTYKGGDDFVATKLDKTGNIVYATYLGGNLNEGAPKIAVQNGELFIAGASLSNNYPVTNGSTVGGANSHVVVTKLKTTGAIGYASYYGGTSFQGNPDIEVVNGEMYLTAHVASDQWPVTNGGIRAGSYDIVFTKFDNNGTILFSTFLGGSGAETTPKIEVENGNVYIAAVSVSNNYPVTNTSTNKGSNDIVITKFNSAGTIVYSTYIGSSSDEGAVLGFEVENDAAYFIALTTGTNYPTTDGTINSGGSDIVLTKLDTGGSIAYATYLGSDGAELSPYLTVLNGEAYIMANTDGSNFPTTDGSTPAGGFDITLTKYSTVGDICYSTRLGGTLSDFSASNPVYVDATTKDVFVMGYSQSNDYPTTTGISNTATDKDLVFTKLKLCPTITAASDLLTPNTQTQCKFGLAQTIVGSAFTYPSSSMPIIYRNGATSGQNQVDEVTYQWQIAPAAGGPWTDISGAILRDYLPSVGGTNQYYRRVTTSCCGTVAVSTSDIAAVLVNGNTAPTVSAGGNYNACPSQAITIGGTPIATGGTAPYTYAWDNGATAVANPSVSPAVNTIYTVTVTDALGCKQIDQAVVNTYTANAGADVGFCAGVPVRIGAAPIAGLGGVTYIWSPATGLSCTTCAQPSASPSAATTYTLTMTIPKSGGGTCSTNDAVLVTPVAAPTTANLAGADKVVCLGDITTMLGTTAESGFTYTWAPGNYLVSNTASSVNFRPGAFIMPTPNPLTYYVTALKGGCTFVDKAEVAVIEARAGVDGCGPRIVGMPDRTPNINETYTWTKVSGPGNFAGATNLPEVPVTASVGGATTYRLTVTYTLNGVLGSCTDDVVVPECGCVVDINVTAPFSCPSYGLNGGNVTMTATAADIFSQDPSVFTYTWSPATGLSTTTGRVVQLTDNVQRTYTVTMTSPFDASFICTRTILVNHPAWSLPVFAAQDHTTCSGTNVSIGQPMVAGYSYNWNSSSGYANTVSNPSVSTAATTDYLVTVTDVVSGCTVKDTATIMIKNPVANAGPDQLVCDNGIVKLGTPAISGNTYSWSPSSASWQNGTSATSAQPEVLVATNLTFTVTVTNIAAGCATTDEVKVTIGTPVPAFTLADVTYCPSTNPALTLGAEAPSGAGYTYQWLPASQVTSPTTRTTNTLTPPPGAATTYTLEVRNASGCGRTDDVTITPTVAAAIAGSDRTICKNTTTTLGSTSNTTGAGITYAWTPASGLSSTTSTTPIFTPSATGTFAFTLTRTESGCSTNSKVTVSVIDFVLPAMTSPTICENSCIDIGTTTQTGVQYFWSPATGLSDATISNPTACLTTTDRNYKLTAVDLNGCVATSTVFVAVNASPAPQITIAPQTVCLSATNVRFNPTVTPAAAYNYQWSPNNGSLSNIYEANPEVYIMGGGILEYNVTVTNTATGCANIGTGILTVEQCPVCTTPAAPVLTVSNNITCPTVINGSINVQTPCAAGTHIEYSTDNGTTWSTTKPIYIATSITVIARCVKDIDDTCISPNSASITTAPTVPQTITNPSSAQSVCASATGANITVQSSRNSTNSIKFVKFTTDQMAGATPTNAEAAAIYAGTSISTVTPTGASAPYTATYIWNSTDFPNATNAMITYYVYAIGEPDGGAGCRPMQEIQISISPTVTAGVGTNPAVICQGGSGLINLDLFGQLAGEMIGGAWSQTSGTAVGTALNTSTGILNPNGLAVGSYIFRYTVIGFAPCPNDTEDVTMTIQQCCPLKICLPITVVRN